MMRKLFLVAGIITSITTPAEAQTSFVPYVVDETMHRSFMAYLGDMPARYANPLINDLTRLSAEAITKKAEADKELLVKPTPTPAPAAPKN